MSALAALALLALGADPGSVDIGQIPSAPQSPVAVQPLTPQPPSAGASQVAVKAAPGAAAPAQVNRDGRSAAAAPALSSPGQGHAAAGVTRLGGADRCDPAATGAAAPKTCANALETRSEEFTPPAAPQPSAEQRLLSRQSDGGVGADQAARNLANGRTDNSQAAEAVAAALTLNAPPKKDEPPAAADATSLETQAILQSILNGTGGHTGP